MSDLLERLRADTGQSVFCALCHEAADEIERLRSDRDHHRRLYCKTDDENAKLEAEIERLRAALRAVVDCDEKYELTAYYNYDDIRKVTARARAALEVVTKL